MSDSRIAETRIAGTRAGTVIHPTHCRFSGAADRSALALTFRGDEGPAHTVVLPIAGAAGLHRQLAQCLHLLGVRPLGPAPANGAQSASVPSAM